MADVSAVKSELQQAINRISAPNEDFVETPEYRRRLEGFMREAAGLALSNKLDPFNNLRPVMRLRETAEDVMVGLDRLPPEDNAPMGNNRGHFINDLRGELRRTLVVARRVIPDRVQPPRGARRKTRKGKGKSRRARYSRRR